MAVLNFRWKEGWKAWKAPNPWPGLRPDHLQAKPGRVGGGISAPRRVRVRVCKDGRREARTAGLAAGCASQMVVGCWRILRG